MDKTAHMKLKIITLDCMPSCAVFFNLIEYHRRLPLFECSAQGGDHFSFFARSEVFNYLRKQSSIP